MTAVVTDLLEFRYISQANYVDNSQNRPALVLGTQLPVKCHLSVGKSDLFIPGTTTFHYQGSKLKVIQLELKFLDQKNAVVLNALDTEVCKPRQEVEKHAKRGLSIPHKSVLTSTNQKETQNLLITSADTHVLMLALYGAILLTQTRDGSTAIQFHHHQCLDQKLAVEKNAQATEVSKSKPEVEEHAKLGLSILHKSVLTSTNQKETQNLLRTSADTHVLMLALSGAIPLTLRRDGSTVIQLQKKLSQYLDQKNVVELNAQNTEENKPRPEVETHAKTGILTSHIVDQAETPF